ncbi:MAG TPA: aromatic ring-hydroxylating dioxygenase subunit alpha [Gemmatimonadota bacterium]|nr:aromatic ring-hydroxylating dioxygenase subunit alpha [Gemmatimonadota bacterium]
MSTVGKEGSATFLETTETYREGARTLPRRYYTASEIFAAEEERIFRREWLCVGREEEIASPGEYFLASVAGESLIVVRDETGACRALFNVCRHRGTRLCETERGRLARSIQCPYHAWTYGLDGRLIGAPDMDRVPGFDRADHPLHRAGIASWEGFLFVNLSAEPIPFQTEYAPILERFARFGIAGLRAWRRIEYDVRANWKLLFQNYSECLHCPVIHPRLSQLTPYRTGQNDLVEGPFLGGYMVLGEKGGSMTMSGRACAPAVAALPDDDFDRVYYYSILPNLLLSLHPDYVMAHRLWPAAPDRTRVVCEWLFHPDAFGAADADPADAVSFWDTTNREDWHICELAQAGISSRRYGPGPYSPRESLPAAWDREYLRRLGGTAAED